MKLKRFLFICFTFILLININLTNAKYVSLEYGDIFNVRLSKYSVYADDFVIFDHDWYQTDANGDYILDANGNKIMKDIVESKKLWGVPNNGGTTGYQLKDLQDVAFTVSNRTTSDIMVSNFIISLSVKNNLTSDLNITLTNTLTESSIEQIKGSIHFQHNGNKSDVSSSHFNINSTSNSYNGNPIHQFLINPLDYYKNVNVTSTSNPDEWWKTTTTNGSINDFEQNNLDKYFIIHPGQTFEFNVDVTATTDKNNAGVTQSVYTDVRMTVVKYTG